MSYGIEDMLEISFKENDDFLKIRETLTRIGVASRKDKQPYMIKSGDAPTKLLIVDDIYDSGYTMKEVIKMLSHYSADIIQGFCLFGKENKLNVSYANEHDGSWVVFPWETLNEPV